MLRCIDRAVAVKLRADDWMDAPRPRPGPWRAGACAKRSQHRRCPRG